MAEPAVETKATPQEGAQGLTTAQAQQSFASMFAVAEDGAVPEEQQAVDAVATESEAVDDQAEEEVEEGEHAEEAESAEPDGDSEAGIFMTLVVDGEEVPATEAEVVKWAQLGKHFTKKNEALIHEQQALQQRTAEIDQLRSDYAAALPQIQQLLEMPLGAEPNRADFSDDTSFLVAQNEWSKGMQRVSAIQAEQQRVAQEQAAQMAERQQAYIQDQQQMLHNKLPAWNSEKTMRKEQEQMAEYAREIGFTDAELANVFDHRLVLVLRDAMRGARARKSGKAKAKQPATKEVAPGPGNDQAELAARQKREAWERAKASGKDRDLAPLMGALILGQEGT